MEENSPPQICLFSQIGLLEMLFSRKASKVINSSRKKVLSMSDLGTVPDYLDAEKWTLRMDFFRRRALKEKRGWVWIIFQTFKRDFVTAISFSICADLLLWSQPFLFRRLIGYLQAGSTMFGLTYGIVILVSAIMFFRLLCIVCTGILFYIGHIARSAMMGIIYRRSLSFQNNECSKYGGGKGVNILISDPTKLATVIYMTNFIWVIPVRIMVAFCVSYYHFGIFALPAIAIIIFIIPVLIYLAQIMRRTSNEQVEMADKRTSLLKEAIQNIKIIKYLCLEGTVDGKIDEARERELDVLLKSNVAYSVSAAIDFWAPVLATTVSIAIASAYMSELDGSTVFAFIQAMGYLVTPLWILPVFIFFYIKAKVAIRRIDNLMHDGGNENVKTKEVLAIVNEKSKEVNESFAIEIDGDFQWESEPVDKFQSKKNRKKLKKKGNANSKSEKEEPFQLSDMKLKIRKGLLVGVFGKSAVGKSSLLYAILGEMPCKRGFSRIQGKVAFCEQNVWLMQGTIRDNILFGLTYDETRYRKVLKECRLETDIAMFDKGDKTVIGEKGSTVSGGQRQRIGLARAAYYHPDIVLLDDPTSALDAKNARRYFENCIKDGIHSTATRIIATHNTSFLPFFDYILILDDGKIIFNGTYSEFMKCQSVQEMVSDTGSVDDDEEARRESVVLVPDLDNSSSNLLNDEEECSYYQEAIEKCASSNSYKTYIRAFGGWWGIFTVLSLSIFSETVRVGRDLLLTSFLEETLTQTIKNIFSMVYGGLGLLQGLLSALSVIAAVLFCKRASRIIHKESMKHLLSVKLSVIDMIPSGRIINRFGRDLDLIDNNFADRIIQIIVSISAVLSLIILLAWRKPGAFVSLIIPFSLTWLIQKRFRRTWRQLQQINGVSTGPLISHFGESQEGLTTIACFKQSNSFIRIFDRHNSKLIYSSTSLLDSRRWATMRIECSWVFYWFFVGVTLIYFKQEPQVIAVILVYIATAVENVDYTMRQIADLESSFVSVDRLHGYVLSLDPDVDKESLYNVPEGWPANGEIIFNDLSVRYKPELPEVISNFSLTIKSGKKVAIVGRSGAGKSTIVAALFKFCPFTNGTILIDGHDIQSVPLSLLRSSLAMVPQDPVLFAGTLRSNLDPKKEFSDDQLWEVLGAVKMSSIISKNPLKLEMPINEGGTEFSNGQRQLLCLARAILKKSPILVLDEATSNLDRETEKVLQANSKLIFQNRTVITIAHRLETILDYDIVVVMAKGRIMERGSPKELAAANGLFASMLKSASIKLI